MAADRRDTVMVYARFRPINVLEQDKDARSCADISEDAASVSITNQDEGTKHRFSFERIFNDATTQQAMYERVGAPLVADVLQGYNATVFAYGQTGSGKTYTMLGPPQHGTASHATPRGPGGGTTGNNDTYDLRGANSGIVPRVVHDLFRRIAKAPTTSCFLVRVSFVEIYMERVNDLLDGGRTNLALREDKANRRFYVEGCTRTEVGSPEQLLDMIDAGSRNRATASTRVNEYSSRSHSIVTIEVTSNDELRETVLNGRLHLVDLAGSEKVSKTHALGQQLDEAKLINKSLTTLSLVITSLSEKRTQPTKHVPYRDSKLTRLLMDSLGGNARTALVVCCSASNWNLAETTSTLRFGSLATEVENHAVVNQELSPDEMRLLITKLEEEVKALRARGSGSSGGGGNLSAVEHQELEQLREDAKQLELVSRSYYKQCSIVDSLRENLQEANEREKLAVSRAERAEAASEPLVRECAAWEAAHRAAYREKQALRKKLESQLRIAGFLRTTLATSHDALEAARVDLSALKVNAAEAQLAIPALEAEVAALRKQLEQERADRRREAEVSEKKLAEAREHGAAQAKAAATAAAAAAEAQSHAAGLADKAAAQEEAQSVAAALEHMVPIGEYTKAVNRAELAEREHRGLYEQWRELLADSTASKLELEFCMKRLGLRNERVTNLQQALKKLKLDLRNEQNLRVQERAKFKETLGLARDEATKWHREAEKANAVLVQRRSSAAAASPMSPQAARNAAQASTLLASTPSRSLGSSFSRYIRGGGTPGSATGSPAASPPVASQVIASPPGTGNNPSATKAHVDPAEDF